MEKKNNNGSEDHDFTSKGRTFNSGTDRDQNEGGSTRDISNMDQQEGNLNHGTTGGNFGTGADQKEEEADS